MCTQHWHEWNECITINNIFLSRIICLKFSQIFAFSRCICETKKKENIHKFLTFLEWTLVQWELRRAPCAHKNICFSHIFCIGIAYQLIGFLQVNMHIRLCYAAQIDGLASLSLSFFSASMQISYNMHRDFSCLYFFIFLSGGGREIWFGGEPSKKRENSTEVIFLDRVPLCRPLKSFLHFFNVKNLLIKMLQWEFYLLNYDMKSTLLLSNLACCCV